MAKAVERATRPEAKDGGIKRPYVSPRLVEYGSVTKLTATNGSILPQDSKTGSMMGGCL